MGNNKYSNLNKKDKKPRDIFGYAIFVDFVALACFGVDRYMEAMYPGAGDLPFYIGILIVVSIITGYAVYIRKKYYN